MALMGDNVVMEALSPLATRAMELAGAGVVGEEGVLQLVDASGGRGALERARDELVGRLRSRSDDYAASKALRLVAIALDRVGFERQPFTAGPTGEKLMKLMGMFRRKG